MGGEEATQVKNGETADEAPLPFCDLVMKGGVTSGVIYPKLIARLATKYRFKNIGGTSAGAIAAGACAAAEYRRVNGCDAGFKQLQELPGLLGASDRPGGPSRLSSLFQPVESLAPHFSVLQRVLNGKSGETSLGMLIGLLLAKRWWLILSILLGALLVAPAFSSLLAQPLTFTLVIWGAAFGALGLTSALSLILLTLRDGWVIGVLGLAGAGSFIGGLMHALFGVLLSPSWLVAFCLAGALCFLVLLPVVGLVFWRFAVTLVRGLEANGFGICSGRTSNVGGDGQPALTDWLTKYLDELAGTSKRSNPITFGDLWGTFDPEGERNINLEVVTSAVSQGMVYGIPLRSGTPTLYYDPKEWAQLFPARVLEWLEEALRLRPDGDRQDNLPEGLNVVSEGGRPLRAMPGRADWPVVVGVRMSLSFPVLLSAIPMYSIDWSLKDNQALQAASRKAKKEGGSFAKDIRATRVWFSDGGIGSNMPLHMFDGMLPDHPTFAINLKAEHPDHGIKVPERKENDGGRIYLPEDSSGGRVRYWREPATKPKLGEFLLSIVHTMQNWRDEIMFPYPGYRDRIAQISLRDGEGGLNLNMPEAAIVALANAGEMAADRLIDRFHPLGSQGGAGWEEHREVRLCTFLSTAQPGSVVTVETLQNDAWQRYVQQTGRLSNNDQRTFASRLLRGLLLFARRGQLKNRSLKDAAMKPVPKVGLTPRV